MDNTVLYCRYGAQNGVQGPASNVQARSRTSARARTGLFVCWEKSIEQCVNSRCEGRKEENCESTCANESESVSREARSTKYAVVLLRL